jgi:uncharacterized protein (TIGR02246 family)
MRRLARLLIGITIATLLQTPSSAAAATDEQAIRELVASYAAARQSQDAKAIEALFTADADQLVSSGEWRRGRDELVRGMLESSRSNAGARTITVESVRLLTAGVAVANARYAIAATAGAEARSMWSTFVVLRVDGGWRIAAIRNMLPSK